MTARALLHRLEDTGVRLTLVQGRIHYQAPEGLLTSEDLTELRAHRDELVGILTGRSHLTWPPPATQKQMIGPLTQTQRAFWATDFFTDDGTYNLAGALHLDGLLDERALQKAMVDLTNRHAALRTVFNSDGSAPVQQVLAPDDPSAAISIEILDRAAADLNTLVAEAGTLADQKIPLGLRPPVRVWLLRASAEESLLVVVLHHVVADAVSVGILLRDFAAAYTAILQSGAPPPVPDASVDLLDLGQWEADRLAYADLTRGRQHWRQTLDSAEPAGLPLPPPLDRTAQRHSAVRHVLDPAATRAVHDFASQQSTSMFSVITAAVAEALGRFTGRDDLVLGMPAGRRDRPELYNLVGPLLTMVPIRLDLKDNPTFGELVHRTRQTILGGLANAESLPQASPAAGDDAGGRGWFNVIVTDLGEDLSPPHLPGLQSQLVEIPRVGAKYDLNVLVTQTPHHLRLDAEFDPTVIDSATVSILLDLCGQIATAGSVTPHHPSSRLASASFGDPGPVAIGQPLLDPPTPTQSLTSRLFDHAQQASGDIAVIDGDQEVTYGSLVTRVDDVARGLRHRGVGRGDIVAISLPRSVDLVVAILSVMAAGAACAVLDDSWPDNRRERVVADAQPACLITEQPISETGQEGTTSLAQLAADGLGAPACPPPPGSAVAYVIYTSGSTGQPKGVHVTHTNVLSLLAATGPGFALGPHDVWSLFHSCSFDVAMYEMFGCLLHGGKLVVVPSWTTRDPEAFADLLAARNVTILSLTPSALSMLLPQAARRPAALSATRYILLAGEKLERRLADQWHREVGDHATLVNLYGITETTVHASWHLLQATEPPTTESNVGVPLPGTSLYLLRDDGTTSAEGCVGEIYVGGPQVSLGYIGRPREMASRFVPDPFTAEAGGRMYRSGDLGRRSGPNLTYLRRRDNQVQVNGFRVELAEVESLLSAQPGVVSAGAAIVSDDIGDRIVAVVVPEPGVQLAVPDVLRSARHDLAAYMIPRSLQVVPALPLTVNGKLDRAAVTRMATAHRDTPQATAFIPIADSTSAAAPAAPHDARTQLLIELFRTVLDVPGLDAHADFFQAGGDSMRAIQLIGLAQDRGLHLQARQVYAAPTPTELAALSSTPTDALATLTPFELLPAALRHLPDDVVDAYPMTALQTGMLYHQEIAPDARVYHIVLSYQVPDRFDEVAFRPAVRAVVDAHDVLRTSLDLASPAGPIQRVHATAEPPIRVEDLRALDRTDQQTRIAGIVAEETTTDFDLNRPGLFRLVVLITGDTEYQLIFAHNHVILDGWSVNLFFQDLVTQYSARLHGSSPASIPVPRTRFADYIARELRAATDGADQQFWRTQTNAGLLLAPTRPPIPVMRQTRRELPGLITPLRQVAQAAQVSVKTLLCAVHMRVLAWLTEASEVVSSTVTNARPEGLDADRTLGLFLNQLPVCADLEDKTWATLARELHQREEQALPHRWYPSALIHRDAGVRAVFDTSFNFTDYHTTQQMLKEGRINFTNSQELEQTHYALSSAYTIDVRTGELRLLLEYDEHAVSATQAEAVLEAHELALTALLHDPNGHALSSPTPGTPALTTSVATKDQYGTPNVRPSRPMPSRQESIAVVREAWADVLGHDGFTDDEDFFRAGGDSLAAMRLISMLRTQAPDLPLRVFLQEPTVVTLAGQLEVSTGKVLDRASRHSLADEIALHQWPLTAAQEQMWSITERLPQLPLFAMPGALQIDGPLDLDVLDRTLAVVARHHDALRTKITTTDNGPVLVVEPTVDLSVKHVDLTVAADPVAECERALTIAVRQPLHTTQAPMARVVAFKVGPQRHVLLFTIHHMVCDGWSLSVLLSDVVRVYGALSAGEEPPSTKWPNISAVELNMTRTRWASTAEAHAQKEYWVRRLAPPWLPLSAGEASRLPSPASASAIELLRSRTCRYTLDAASTTRLRRTCHDLGLTTFAALATAYAQTLAKWSGQRDIRIGTVQANRTRPGSEGVVGLLANSAVLRVEVDPADPIATIESVRTACEDAFAHQEVPFEDVLKDLAHKHPQEMQEGSLFDAMLVLQEEIAEAQTGELRFTAYRAHSDVLASPTTVTTCDLLLNVVPWDEDLVLSLQYRPAVTNHSTAQALLTDIAEQVMALTEGSVGYA